jgi:sugar-specific transcriptional regulator TrmB
MTDRVYLTFCSKYYLRQYEKLKNSPILGVNVDIPELGRIGLLKNDRTVYLLLLETGSVTVSALVKKCGLHRSYVYDILDKLIDLGLVSFTVKNNKKFFNAENPERIIKVMDDKKEEIEKDKEAIGGIIPQLLEKQRNVLNKQEAKVFMGKEGIKSILEDILGVGKSFVGFGAEGKFKEIYKWYFSNWNRRRVQQKIKYKIIYNRKLRGKRPATEQKLVQARFLPEKYEFPATTIVYGNKVAILLWEKSPIGFVLDSKEITKSFLNYFEIIWKMAKP